MRTDDRMGTNDFGGIPILMHGLRVIGSELFFLGSLQTVI
jgi:hypothetical protein